MKLQIKAQDTRPLVKVEFHLHPDIVTRIDQAKDLGPRDYLAHQAFDITLPPLKNGKVKREGA